MKNIWKDKLGNRSCLDIRRILKFGENTNNYISKNNYEIFNML